MRSQICALAQNRQHRLWSRGEGVEESATFIAERNLAESRHAPAIGSHQTQTLRQTAVNRVAHGRVDFGPWVGESG